MDITADWVGIAAIVSLLAACSRVIAQKHTESEPVKREFPMPDTGS